jgi:hypothetical protein
VFGTEKRDERHARGAGDKLNYGTALRIEAGVIGDQSNVLAAQRREPLGFQHIEAGLDMPAACSCRGSCEQKNNEKNSAKRPTGRGAAEMRIGSDAMHEALMICWNAHVVAAL